MPHRPRPEHARRRHAVADGHLALHYARIFGCRTVAVDVEDAKPDLSRELGADVAIDDAGSGTPGNSGDVLQVLGGVDVAVVLAPRPSCSSRRTDLFVGVGGWCWCPCRRRTG